MSSNNDNIEGQPPAKRQRRSLGASDRVVLDVGGTKFITSASTLTSNSAYFASLSDNWIESNNGDDEIFIDQDPVPFKILLAYMRRGNIKVDDIDTDVLSLAEFLGMERLLLAIKVRWYRNIGKGPVVSTDDEIAVAFDKRGGMKAISSGLFPYFLRPNDVDADKDYAVLSITDEGYKLKEAGKSGPEHETYGIYGALNSLHLKRYTYHESQLRTNETYTFSRRKHATIDRSGATDIFIPNNNEIVGQERKSYVKQFVAVVDHENENVAFRSIRYHRQNDAVITNPGSWLEENGFVTREDEYERIFREHFEESLADKKISMFSRVISKSRDDASW